jgi:hypothetical protein
LKKREVKVKQKHHQIVAAALKPPFIQDKVLLTKFGI